MILSISRRTDIPACYSGWLAKRLEEGYVLVPNPRNPRRFSKVMLTGEQVECAVFWSKNPAPILPLLEHLPFPFYVQYTLNPYGPDWEPGLPSIQDSGTLDFCTFKPIWNLTIDLSEYPNKWPQ